MRLLTLGVTMTLCLAALAPARAEDVKPVHALAMHGEPKYGADFQHFDYVNPDAPKGGEVKLSAIGTFDNLNPFILKGVADASIDDYTFDTLTVQSHDEAFTEYGLIAETIEIPPDRSWVAYTLRPEARFHDGSPVTVEDVIFTFETLKSKGHPFYRAYYANVEKAEKVGERKVKFSFSGGVNRELPLIMGQMAVLSKKDWEGKNFEETTLKAPLGSGPYQVKSVDPGRSITYERVKDYWAADLPVKRGLNNFDTIRIDYRDRTVTLQAFKAGDYDFRAESAARTGPPAMTAPFARPIKRKKSATKSPRACRVLYSTRGASFSRTPEYAERARLRLRF
ncbi:MAG: extracellular solute-binding protein [Gammaproteobacteria bacterium]